MSASTSAEDTNALDQSGSNGGSAFPHGVEGVNHDARAASVATAAGFGVSVLALETHPMHQFQQGAAATASSPPPSSVAVATAELVVQNQNAPPPKRKGGRAKDVIWNETTIMEDKTVVCNHCNAVIHKYGCAKVERVRAHFQNRCLQSASYQNRNVHATATKKQKTVHSPFSGNADAVNRRGTESVVAKVGLFKRKFAQWVYASGQAFDDMENEFLVNALCTLRPDVPLPSRDELENELLELECNATQAKVNKALSGKACILAIEHWTNASGVVHTNYVALCDSTPYLLECTTSSQTQEPGTAAEVPVEELEAVLAKHKKCAFYAIVTTEKSMLSNATCERIQKKHLQCVFYYGCVRHALRLLVNDITAILPWLEKTRDSVTELLRVVQGSYKLQQQVPCLPRVGADGNLGSLSSYDQVFDALEAILSSEKELYAIVSRRDFVETSRSPVEKEQRKRIQDFVLGETFVHDVNNALKLVRPLQQQLLRVESDRGATLSQVYHCFAELLDTYASMEWVSKKDKALISSCVKERLHSIYGDAHGVAYMLDPLYLGEHLDATKKSDVEAFITSYCNSLEPEKILVQLEKYKAMVHELKECNSTYWKMLESGEVRTFDFWIERRQFPQLQQLAWAVFSLPNASTTPSKSFSAQCQLTHSKFHARLSSEKLQRLTQVYCNAKSVAVTSADGAELSPLSAVADATTFASSNSSSAILKPDQVSRSHHLQKEKQRSMDDDAYAEDEFEASADDGGEDEVRPPASPAAVDEHDVEAATPTRQRSRAIEDALAIDDNALLGSDEDDKDDDGDRGSGGEYGGESGGARNTRTAKKKQTRKPRVSGQHLLDSSRWTFTIRATRIRALQLPTTLTHAVGYGRSHGDTTPAIRELRVFAALSKQSMQSHGSEWKREPRLETPRLQMNLRERTKRQAANRASPRFSRNPTTNRASPASALGRRSGFLDEARWRDDRGTLQWTFSMEKFRHLKAYTPRVKVLVYGIAMHATDDSVRRLRDHSAQAANDSVVSFGWFFLDLRTPDLPEKWFKLQNSPFGGEILISTIFAPFGHESATLLSPAKASDELQADSSDHRRRQSTPFGKSTNTAIQKNVLVVAMEDGEFLRLGSRHGSDVFVISVSLQAAFNLAEVVETTLGPREMAPDDYKAGFWLSYSLFDVVVRTDVFHNLDTSEFPPIRDSFRVMSCVEDLQDWYQQQQTLPIYLCTYNRVLGGVEIPFSALLEGEMFSLALKSNKPTTGTQAVADGNFPFPSTNGPFVDASVSIQCVHTARSPKPVPTQFSNTVQPEPASTSDPAQKATGGDANDLEEKPEADDQVIPAVLDVNVYLDQIQLSNDAVSQFVGEESISLELSFGSAVISGTVRFCAYTKTHVLGGNDALKLKVANVVLQDLNASTLRARSFSSDTKTLVGTSTSLAPFSESVDIEDVKSYFSKHMEIPLYSDEREHVGQCIVRLHVRDLQDPEEEEESSSEPSIVSARNITRSDVHMYHVFLQLKSLRDFDKPQQLSIAFQNPFTGKGKVEFTGVQVAKKSEVYLADSFCMFELMYDEEQFKDSMQSAVAIDFVSESGSRCRIELLDRSSIGHHHEISAMHLPHLCLFRQREIFGNCLFSLNFLYYSQDQFCCAEPSCGKTFRSQLDGEAHWEENHGSRQTLRVEDRVHRFKSCSIAIPVIGIKDPRDARVVPSSRRRIGMVEIVAYIEDMGVLSDEDVTVAERLVVSQPYIEGMRVYDSFSPPRRISTKRSSGDGNRGASIAKEPEPSTVSRLGNGSIPALSSAHDATLEERERCRRQLDEEKVREMSRLKESFEREKQMWIQEQRMQQLQWRRRLEGTEKARMQELEEEWARREEERRSLVRTAQAEYERLEKTLRSSLLELEARERRFAIAESALQREQQTQKEENERFRRRIQSDQSHALSLAQKQAESQERRVAMLESQLKEAEARARQVEADFAEYRQQQRKVPESRLREEISALKGTILELEKQKMQQEKLCEVAEANIAALKMQIEKMVKLVQNEKKKNETRVVDELEKLRVKYIAREEKYVLDGDREELRAIKKQLDELKGFDLRRSPDHADQFEVFSPQDRRGAVDRKVLSPQSVHSSLHRSETDSRRYRTSSIRHMQSGHHTAVPRRFHSGRDSTRKWRSESLVRDHRQRFSREPDPIQDDSHQSSMNDSSEYYGDDGEEDEDDSEDADDIENEFHHHNADLELDRLERERKLLLASGAYNEQSYLVRELARLIEATKANGMQHQDPLL
ncbi:Zinc finger, c2h2, partial [Globisporangium splendens]